MILLKLAALFFFAYMLARGMAREDNIAREEAEARILEVQKYAEELQRLHEAENKMLVKTIRELRDELDGVKIKNENLLEFRKEMR